MSVGGKVIEVIEVCPDMVWVNTVDKGFGYQEQCAVYANPLGNKIEVGDSLWWQSKKCYWTKCVNGVRVGQADIPLPKIGYSGASRPDDVLVE